MSSDPKDEIVGGIKRPEGAGLFDHLKGPTASEETVPDRQPGTPGARAATGDVPPNLRRRQPTRRPG